MKQADLSDRVEKMLAGVRRAGLKLTPQRMAIVKELASDETHPTAQEIFERLRPGLPTMSFAMCAARCAMCHPLAPAPTRRIRRSRKRSAKSCRASKSVR